MSKIIRLPSVTASPAPTIGAGDRMPAYLDAHLKWLRLRGLAANSIYQRGRAVTRLHATLGINLFTATEAMMQGWRSGLECRLSHQGIACEVSHVRQFFDWAVEAGYMPANPAARLAVPRLGRRLPRPIGEHDLFAAVACAPPRIRPWLVLAGWAGLRAKEIALLRRSAVLDTARPPYLLIAVDATKGRSERAVPLSAFVLEELLPVLPPSGWVFRRADGEPGPNHPGRLSKLCNTHLDECGIDATLHQLRHRFLTEAYRVSRDIRLVQELAGHASPVTTAGYAAVNQADAIAAVQAIPAPRRLRSISG